MPDEATSEATSETTSEAASAMTSGLKARVLATAEQLLELFRTHTPVALLPLVVWVRHRLAWARSSVRADARSQMEFLRGETRPDADPETDLDAGPDAGPDAGLDASAREYVKQMVRRGEVRWHPDVVTGLRLKGIEHLVAARDLGRGVVLSFMHHGFYDSAFSPIALAGVPARLMVYPYMARADAPRWVKQHVRINSIGGGIPTSTEIGTQGILDLLTGGAVVAIATDVPGRTPVRFAGRDLLGSFGAARVAKTTGSPVVLMTSEQDARGPFVRLHEALHPEDFETPQALLAEIIARHEKAVVAWPEVADIPRSRWGDPAQQGEGG